MNIVKIPFIAFFLVSVNSFASDYTLVSDYDDTFKITDVQYPAHKAFTALFSHKTFIGVPEYYSNIPDTNLIILSGSPEFLRKKINKTLQRSGLVNPIEVLLRPSSLKTKDFKTQTLERLSNEGKGPFVLIGDDTQHDPDVYAEFAEKNPGKVLAIYIRKIINRNLPTGVIGVYSTYEIANHEYKNGRLSLEVMQSVALATLKVDRGFRLFPDFSVCPNSAADISLLLVDDLSNSVRDHLIKVCKDRNYTPFSQRKHQ